MADIQVTSPVLPVERGSVSERWEAAGVCRLHVGDSTAVGAGAAGKPTCWSFESDLVPWSRGLTPLRVTATRLVSLKSLCREGAYWAVHNNWKRVYTTRNGVDIMLVEDVPESGGQNCLWAAGLVMARYIENPSIAISFRGRRILELGAGAGLTSMVAACVGGDVYSTEQDSCMKYLESNLRLNAHLPPVTARTLHWMNDYSGELFDVILGCDITYDTKMIGAIFETLSLCLRPTGICYICHDDDSCPMSPEALAKLLKIAADTGFEVNQVAYETFVEPCFTSKTVRMWKITRL
jgi:predicted nicotinamide N-methyase